MATHSSILAWKIPWTEEPLVTVRGVTGVRHNLATKPPPPGVCTLETIGNLIYDVCDQRFQSLSPMKSYGPGRTVLWFSCN